MQELAVDTRLTGRVVQRGDVFRYKGKDIDIQKLGKIIRSAPRGWVIA